MWRELLRKPCAKPLQELSCSGEIRCLFKSASAEACLRAELVKLVHLEGNCFESAGHTCKVRLTGSGGRR